MRHILIGLSLLPVLYLIIFKPEIKLHHPIYGLFSASLIAGVLYELFDCISLRIQGRTFYLLARGAKDVVGLGLAKHNPHLSTSDRLFSFMLIFFSGLWPLLYGVFGKYFH
jgi:hypothetical protein